MSYLRTVSARWIIPKCGTEMIRESVFVCCEEWVRNVPSFYCGWTHSTLKWIETGINCLGVHCYKMIWISYLKAVMYRWKEMTACILGAEQTSLNPFTDMFGNDKQWNKDIFTTTFIISDLTFWVCKICHYHIHNNCECSPVML